MFVNFNILNQLGSPAINSNTFANRPAAGQTGRLFVSTDTFEIYRDNGTTWDLIGGPGTSTITGTGTATQVAFFTSSQAIGSNVNLYWDNVNERLGIGTTTPSSKLDIAGSNTLLHLKGGSNAYMMYHGNGVDEYKVGYTDGPVAYRRWSVYDESGAKEVLTIDKQSRYVGINYQYSSLADQPAYTLDVEGSGRFTNSAYFVSSGSGQVGINTLAPTATALMQADKTDGYGLYLNYTTNAGTGSSATALWSLNTTNGSGYSAVIEEKTPNTTAGQYPLLVKHSLSAGTAGVGMGTGIHFQLPDNAGTFRTTQLTIETTDAAAATYTSRYRFMAQVGGTSTALAYLTSTGLGINGIPTRALELFTNTSTQTAALVLNNAATTPKGYLGTYTNNLYITQGGTFNTSWAADGTNAISAIILGANNNSSTILFQTTNANNSTPLTRMYISEAGNVGIGTTGPLYQLDLGGGTTIAERLRLQRGSDDTAQYATFGYNQINVYRVTTPLSSPQTDFSINQVGSDGSRTPFYISSGGNVGVGTTNPATRLHIIGNGHPLVIASNEANLVYTTYKYNTTTDVGYIGNGVGAISGGAAADFGIAAATGNLLFASGGVTERMRITSAGNLDIASPNSSLARLNVANISAGSTTKGLALFNNSSSASVNTGISIEFYPNVGNNDRAAIISSVQDVSGNYADLRFFTAANAASAERMRITSGGFVGIGTQTPATTLDVNGLVRSFISGNSTRFISTDGTVEARLGTYTTPLGYVGTESNHPFAIYTSGSEKIRITSGGNVLINTQTDAGYKLDVNGTTRSCYANKFGTYTQGTTTPSVSNVSILSISNSLATTITNFTNAVAGQILYLIFTDSNTTIDRSNAYLAGGVNFTSTSADTLTLIYDGTYWYEISRSINS